MFGEVIFTHHHVVCALFNVWHCSIVTAVCEIVVSSFWCCTSVGLHQLRLYQNTWYHCIAIGLIVLLDCCCVCRCLASAVCSYTVLLHLLDFITVYLSAIRHMQFSCHSRAQAQWQQPRAACHAPSKHAIEFCYCDCWYLLHLQQCVCLDAWCVQHFDNMYFKLFFWTLHLHEFLSNCTFIRRLVLEVNVNPYAWINSPVDVNIKIEH